MWNEKKMRARSRREAGRDTMDTALPFDGEFVVGALDLIVGRGAFDALACGGDGITLGAWRQYSVRDQSR